MRKREIDLKKERYRERERMIKEERQRKNKKGEIDRGSERDIKRYR